MSFPTLVVGGILLVFILGVAILAIMEAREVNRFHECFGFSPNGLSTSKRREKTPIVEYAILLIAKDAANAKDTPRYSKRLAEYWNAVRLAQIYGFEPSIPTRYEDS